MLSFGSIGRLIVRVDLSSYRSCRSVVVPFVSIGRLIVRLVQTSYCCFFFAVPVLLTLLCLEISFLKTKTEVDRNRDVYDLLKHAVCHVV